VAGCPEPEDDTATSATASASGTPTTASASASASDTATGSTTETTGTDETRGASTTTGTTGETVGTATESSGAETDSTTTDATTTDAATTDAATTDATTTDATTTDATTTGGDIEPFFPPCDELAIGEPITLDDLQKPSSRRTPAGLAWDGADLVVVRDDRDEETNTCEIVFERRSPTGELLGPGVRSPSKGVCQFNGSLGYNPSSDTFLFTQQLPTPRVGLVGLDAEGSVLWEKTEWDVCNSLTQTIDVAPRGDGFAVMGEVYSCSGVGPRYVAAAHYTPEGVREYLVQTAKATYQAGDAACDLPACDRLMTLRYGPVGDVNGLYAEMGDLVLGEMLGGAEKLNGQAYGGWDASGAVWNGDDWLTIRIEDTGPSHKAHVRRWDEEQGWVDGGVTFGSGGTPTELEMLWTGHDYVVFFAEWPDDNSGFPDEEYDLDIHYLLIGADGAIKQHTIFERAIGYGGYSPQLVALPGAIGLSWVRVAKDGNATLFSRHLAMIECAK
jgi:hypothetical protein